MVPPYSEDDGTEVKNQVYLFRVGNNSYAYTILGDEEVNDGATLLYKSFHVKGIHVWKYDGNETPYNINDELPSTEGKTIKPLPGDTHAALTGITEYHYDLKPYKKITASDILSIARIIVGEQKLYVEDIMDHDYNLDESIDEQDLTIMLKYYTSYPYNIFWRLNEEAFIRYEYLLKKFPTISNLAILCTSDTSPVEYAFNIPAGDIRDDFEGATSGTPIQVLPISMLDQVSAEYEYDDFCADVERDYIMWDPYLKCWSDISSNNSDNWWFISGIYIYLVDENGNYQRTWFKP